MVILKISYSFLNDNMTFLTLNKRTYSIKFVEHVLFDSIEFKNKIE